MTETRTTTHAVMDAPGVYYIGMRAPLTLEATDEPGRFHVLLQGAIRLGWVEGLPDDFDQAIWSVTPASVLRRHGRDELQKLRAQPFPQKDCGCIVNWGGYSIRACEQHHLEDDVRLENARCDHGAPLGKCRRCDIEAERLVRDDRRMIDEAQR